MRAALPWKQSSDARLVRGRDAREDAEATRIERMSMASHDLVPFVVMCTLAAAVYSLACWVGWWF
jgi:hypothetical protein